MQATAEMLTALEPGEWLVRCVRDRWTVPPDHIAIAQASRALSHGVPEPGTYHSHTPNNSQAACLEGEQ